MSNKFNGNLYEIIKKFEISFNVKFLIEFLFRKQLHNFRTQQKIWSLFIGIEFLSPSSFPIKLNFFIMKRPI